MTVSKKQKTPVLPRTTDDHAAAKLSDRQRAVLKSLAAYGDWAQPMDVGGPQRQPPLGDAKRTRQSRARRAQEAARDVLLPRFDAAPATRRQPLGRHRRPPPVAQVLLQGQLPLQDHARRATGDRQGVRRPPPLLPAKLKDGHYVKPYDLLAPRGRATLVRPPRGLDRLARAGDQLPRHGRRRPSRVQGQRAASLAVTQRHPAKQADPDRRGALAHVLSAKRLPADLRSVPGVTRDAVSARNSPASARSS